MAVNSYQDLRVWQMGMELVEETYKVSLTFPPHERYGLAQQIQRAAVSIPSNIAEGHERHHIKEYLHHLSMAQASLAELETQLLIAIRLKYLTEEQSAMARQTADSLGRQIRALRSTLAKRTSE
ncbi:MAG: four helix bundle protein [SAR202 cluster bacterium]|nr:four helix bundle protein [SAR202 cluster bacterium]